MSNLLSTLNEAANQFGGGGGIIGRAEITAGFKVYASGQPQADTWFVCDHTNKESRTAAMEKAKAYALQVGAKLPKNLSLQMKVFKAGAYAKGAPATWQDDRYFNYELWGGKQKNEEQQIFEKALEDVALPTLPWAGWLRVGFAPSPSGRTKPDHQTGEPKVVQIAYPVELFADEKTALAAVVKSEGGDGTSAPQAGGDAPAGFTAKEWESSKVDVTDFYRGAYAKAKGSPERRRKTAMDETIGYWWKADLSEVTEEERAGWEKAIASLNINLD